MKRNTYLSRASQQGAALVVSLLILLVLTLIGVTGMQTTSLEEKMTGNMRDRNLAFQSSESALRAGEDYLLKLGTLPAFANSAGLYQPSVVVPNYWNKDDDTWWTTADNIKTYITSTFASIATNAAAYIIEELPEVPEPTGSLEAGVPRETNYFRVTARGVGGTTSAVVMVQSVVKR